MEVRATAKINLFLKVLDRRPDGYHNIETVYQSVGLADRLWFSLAAEGVCFECPSCNLPTGSDNLVVRAAELMRRSFPGRVGGLHIVLEKHIPIASGLGGGSADAAATLKASSTLFRLGLSAEQLRALGSQLGMDVPFLIEGGRAIGTAGGDRLQTLEVRHPAWAVVAVPDVAVSTRWAYEQLDRAQARQSPPLETFIERLETEPLDRWAGMCYNAFESVVFPAHPHLEKIRDRLVQVGCAGAFLCGSGGAVAGLTENAELAARVAEKIAGLCRRVEAVPFLTEASPAEGTGTLFG